MKPKKNVRQNFHGLGENIKIIPQRTAHLESLHRFWPTGRQEGSILKSNHSCKIYILLASFCALS